MDDHEASNTCSFDLYSDIIEDNFQQKQSSYSELEQKFDSIQAEVGVLRQQLEEATTKVQLYQTENLTLKKNMSSLLKTAKSEIQRKNDEIKRLRSCIEHRLRRQQRSYLHRRSGHDLSNPPAGESCDSVTDTGRSAGDLGFSKYDLGKKHEVSHRIDSRNSPGKTASGHAGRRVVSVETDRTAADQEGSSLRHPCEQLEKSKFPARMVEGLVSEARKKSDHKSFERNHIKDDKQSVTEKYKDRKPTDLRCKLNNKSIDVSRGRLEGKQVKTTQRSSDTDKSKDISNRARELVRGRNVDKENCSTGESPHSSGSRKRRHITETPTSSKRTKTSKSPQEVTQKKTSTLRKYLQVSPVSHSTAKSSLHIRGDDNAVSSTVTDKTKSVTDKTKLVTDKSKSVTDKTKSATDKTKSVTDKSKSVTDKTKSVTDKTKSVTDKTKSVTDKTKSVTDKTKSVTDKTKSVTDETKSVTDETKSVTEKTNSLSVTDKTNLLSVADKTKVVADETKAVTVETKAVIVETNKADMEIDSGVDSQEDVKTPVGRITNTETVQVSESAENPLEHPVSVEIGQGCSNRELTQSVDSKSKKEHEVDKETRNMTLCSDKFHTVEHVTSYLAPKECLAYELHEKVSVFAEMKECEKLVIDNLVKKVDRQKNNSDQAVNSISKTQESISPARRESVLSPNCVLGSGVVDNIPEAVKERKTTATENQSVLDMTDISSDHRDELTENFSKRSVLSADTMSCSSSEASLECCQRIQPRRDSVCTVTSTTLWEADFTTWVQGVEVVDGVKRYRLKILKKGGPSSSCSAESQMSSATASPVKLSRSGLTNEDSKAASPLKKAELKSFGSISEIKTFESISEVNLSDEAFNGGQCVTEQSPFRTPIATPSLDKLPDSDPVESPKASPKKMLSVINVSKPQGSVKDADNFATTNNIPPSQKRARRDDKNIHGKDTGRRQITTHRKESSSAVQLRERNISDKQSSRRRRDSREGRPYKSSGSSREKKPKKPDDSVSKSPEVRRSRRNSEVKRSPVQQLSERERLHGSLNETSESLLSIPDDVYVYIGEESVLETPDPKTVSPKSKTQEGEAVISDLKPPTCEPSCGDETETAAGTEAPDTQVLETAEVHTADGIKKLDSPCRSKNILQSESFNNSVSESVNNSASELLNGQSLIEDGEILNGESEVEVEEGELTSDSDDYSQASPEKTDPKLYPSQPSNDSPITDLRQKLLGKKPRTESRKVGRTPCSPPPSLGPRRRSSESRRDRAKSPPYSRESCHSAQQVSKHGHHDHHRCRSPKGRHSCDVEHTTPDRGRRQGRSRNEPSRGSSAPRRHHPSSPKAAPIKERGHHLSSGSNRPQRGSEDTGRSLCRTRSRSTSSGRSTHSHQSDTSAKNACQCCSRHQERKRSPQCCDRKGSRSHCGDKNRNGSLSPPRRCCNGEERHGSAHRDCERDGHDRKDASHRRYSYRPHHERGSHSPQRCAARRPVSPPPEVRCADRHRGEGHDHLSPCHKDRGRPLSRKTSDNRDRSSRSGAESKNREGTDRGRRPPPEGHKLSGR